MNYYYITGTSRGLGKAFAEYLLKDNSNFVIGISRNSSINHPNYKHVSLDLADINLVKDFHFAHHKQAKKIVLINNAGTLGFIKAVGSLTSETIIGSYHLNLIAPCLLTNSFMAFYKKYSGRENNREC